MMGRGAEGGCGTEEKFCRSISSKLSSLQPQPKKPIIPFHDQAFKALGDRSPFDSSEDASVSRVSTLPVGLADFLSKYTQTRNHKRHKKSSSDSPSQPPPTQSHGSSSIWAETEDYFRPLTFPDIKYLVPLSSHSVSVSSLPHSCFSIPPLSSEEAEKKKINESDNNNVLQQQEQSEQQQHSMEIDVEIDKLATASAVSSDGLEWLLGSRNKVFLNSERPSKKRKLLGSDAGLDRLRVEQPYREDENSRVCHLCCLGEVDKLSDLLLVCNSCKVAVHQRCYGVEDVPVGPWLCSWCNGGNVGNGGNDSELVEKPCLLCPILGGALKPVEKDDSESSGSEKFVHLFCSQWAYEVYVGDTRTMEPVMNVKTIKEQRKRLVCYICKTKYGACVRCSHGTCRTSFHPICAREAGHRMEIWGKTGSETVELRAFCSKHSELQEIGVKLQSNGSSVLAVGSNSTGSQDLPATLLMNKPFKLKFEQKNGEKNMVNNASDVGSEKLDNSAILGEREVFDPTLNGRYRLHGTQFTGCMETPEWDNNVISLDLVEALKKLIDRGKAILPDVALEIGISSELLAATVAGDQSCSPDLQCKILKWLRNHAYMGTSHQNLRSRDNAEILSSGGIAGSDGPSASAIASHENSCAVHAKSIPPRKTKSSVKTSKDNNILCSSNGTSVQKSDNGIVIDDANVDSLVGNCDLKESGTVDRSHSPPGDSCIKENDIMEKISYERFIPQDMGSHVQQLIEREELANGNNTLTKIQAEGDNDSVRGVITKSTSLETADVLKFISGESFSCDYVHPFIKKRLIQMQNGMPVKQENSNPFCEGPKEKDHNSDALKLGQLVKARKMGILELTPEDEVEGQLVYLQNKLLDHAAASKNLCDKLMFSVVRALPEELDATRKQRWDSVLVNQYLCGLREAKKQGRKEKRHKEAQAVLAAATAAAAASSRISSFRKDSHDEASQLEVPLKVMPRTKETLSRLAVTRVSSEKPSFLKENPQLCDVCRRSETMLNPIIVCCNCKVPVHLGCYRCVKDPSGPWYCELCEEQLPCRGFLVNSQEESSVITHCGLCGGTTGAFRRSSDGQWVHAFCAEWLLESTFRRGQPNLVDGMEAISKETEVCCICHRKCGSCFKCNFGNCQSTFHPSCARNSGLYMHVKTGGVKMQHKAYCEKHSLEQREKAEAQQHGPEELRSIKQIRVELERVRLLCERIIKREKLKRELAVCSHDILASKRDSVAFSVLYRSPFFLPDVSSESATTSLRGHVNDNRSCSEAMQRSEEITMDSAISCKRRDMLTFPLDVDQKTDDSSTSQHHFTRTSTDRNQFSGKQLPHRPVTVASHNLIDEAERKLKSRKHTETFQKELVMTSDQASVQNQRLPKGFAYVPVLCLPKQKAAAHETDSVESVEPDG